MSLMRSKLISTGCCFGSALLGLIRSFVYNCQQSFLISSSAQTFQLCTNACNRHKARQILDTLPSSASHPFNAMFSLSLLPLLLSLPLALGLDNTALRQRRVYQLVTDRFASPTNSSSTPCNVAAAPYCGGTYRGVIGKLDYIKGMGFDTVWISPVVQNIGGNTGHGQAYHGYWTLNPDQLVSFFQNNCQQDYEIVIFQLESTWSSG